MTRQVGVVTPRAQGFYAKLFRCFSCNLTRIQHAVDITMSKLRAICCMSNTTRGGFFKTVVVARIKGFALEDAALADDPLLKAAAIKEVDADEFDDGSGEGGGGSGEVGAGGAVAGWGLDAEGEAKLAPKVKAREGGIEAVDVEVGALLVPFRVGSEPAAKGGVVVAAAKVSEVSFWVVTFGAETVGIGGVLGLTLAIGCVAVGCLGVAGEVEEGGDGAAVVVDGDVGGGGELDGDGGTNFCTVAYT